MPSSVEINLPVPVKKIFFRIFTMYGPGGHLGHVTSIISKIFISMYLKAYIQNLIKTAQWFLRKACFNFHT